MSEEFVGQKSFTIEEPACFRRAALYCSAVAGICITQAILAYPDLWGGIAWVLGAGYFFTAPKAMRQGGEKRRIMIGILAVVLVLLSVSGLLLFQSKSGLLYAFISLVTLFFAIPMVRIFGYNRDVAAFVAGRSRALKKARH